MHIDSQALAGYPQRYRTQLINSIAGFKSANLVGTVARDGATNLAIINSVFHLGAHPPLLGLVIRPHSAPRHTLENILATGCYTINHVNRDIFKQAHQTSARYPRDTSEFQATGLSELWREGFPAPFVGESRIRLAMELREHHSLAINGTELVIGEIVALDLPDDALGEDGFVDIESAGSLAVIGLDSYHTTARIDRLAYAKPDIEPASLRPRPSTPPFTS